MEHFRFDFAEGIFALLGEESGDGHADALYDLFIRIHEGFAQFFGGFSAQSGFSAAAHADEDKIGAFFHQASVDFIDAAIIDFRIQKNFHSIFCLGHQHFQAACSGDAPLFRLQDKLGAQGVIDHIGHAAKVREFA